MALDQQHDAAVAPAVEGGGAEPMGGGGSQIDAAMRRTGGSRQPPRDLAAMWTGGPTEGGTGGPNPGAAAPNPGANAANAPAAQHTTITSRVHTPAAGNSDLARTTVGVGEEVHFTGHGDGNWTALSTTGASASGVGSEFDWTAPDVAGTVTISHARQGQGAETIRMTVIAPTSIDFHKFIDEPQVPAGAGMHTRLTFQPLDVSFYRAEWLEVPTNAENVTGYFLGRQATGHNLRHSSATPTWSGMGDGNADIRDHAFTSANPQPWSDGDYEWNIPNMYRVVGTGGDGHLITNVVQHFHMDANGRVTVSKGGQSATQEPSGVMTGATEQTTDKAQTVTQAANYIASFGFVEALALLANYRAHHQDSYQNLLTALTQAAPQHYFYLQLNCNNSYSWVMSDSGSVGVGGVGRAVLRSFDVDTGQHKIFQIPFLDLFDLATFDSSAEVVITPVIEGHHMEIRGRFPFRDLYDLVLPGSSGRYTIRAFIHDPGH